MQIYRKNVERSEAGDRVAVCVTQFDPKLLERGIACSPGLLCPALAVITSIQRVKYFKAQILSKAKFHITIGHETVIGKLTIFCDPRAADMKGFNFEDEYLYCSSLNDPSQEESQPSGHQFALIEFEKPIFIVPDSLFISSKLDMDVNSNSCRIAFYGKVLETFSDKNYTQTMLPKLKIYKNKYKIGILDRVVNEREVVCKDMFKKETRLDLFTGLKVVLDTGENGVINGCFGQSGKIRVSIPQGLLPDTITKVGLKKSKKNKSENNESTVKDIIRIELKFKQYIYDSEKKIVQSKDR